jgi:hypothetical protein
VIWLLDTNIFIPALNGRPGVRDHLNQAAAAGQVVTSVLVLGDGTTTGRCQWPRRTGAREDHPANARA